MRVRRTFTTPCLARVAPRGPMIALVVTISGTAPAPGGRGCGVVAVCVDGRRWHGRPRSFRARRRTRRQQRFLAWAYRGQAGRAGERAAPRGRRSCRRRGPRQDGRAQRVHDQPVGGRLHADRRLGRGDARRRACHQRHGVRRLAALCVRRAGERDVRAEHGARARPLHPLLGDGPRLDGARDVVPGPDTPWWTSTVSATC